MYVHKYLYVNLTRSPNIFRINSEFDRKMESCFRNFLIAKRNYASDLKMTRSISIKLKNGNISFLYIFVVLFFKKL